MLNNRSTNRIDPVLLLLLRIGDEIHRLAPRRHLERKLPIKNILCALDGEAGGNRDDTAWSGRAGDGRFLEPEESSLFQDEPAAAPRLDVLTLLGEPAGAFGVGPVLNAVVVFFRLSVTHRGSP